LTQQQYLYRIRPARLAMLTQGPTPEEEDTVAAHFAYLKDLTANGIVLLAGRTLNVDEETFGIVIFQAESEAAAETIMTADPAVQAGVMTAQLFSFRIALTGQISKP
jgi:uncharacterized protein YciI